MGYRPIVIQSSSVRFPLPSLALPTRYGGVRNANAAAPNAPGSGCRTNEKPKVRVWLGAGEGAPPFVAEGGSAPFVAVVTLPHPPSSSELTITPSRGARPRRNSLTTVETS